MSDFFKQEIYQLLQEKKIPFDCLEHEAVHTMEEMDKAGITRKGTVCKNLFLRDAKGKTHFLVTVPEAKRIDLKQLSEQLGSSRLSFASAERLSRYLKVEQGCVSPLGILNDESQSVLFIADEDLKQDPAVGVHPNDNTATIWLDFQDLLNLIQEHGNEIRFITLPA